MIFKIMNLQSQNQIASLSLDCGASRNVPRKRDARVTQDAKRPKSRTVHMVVQDPRSHNPRLHRHPPATGGNSLLSLKTTFHSAKVREYVPSQTVF
jgi:hypothetical protein